MITRITSLSEVDPGALIALGQQFFLEFKLPGIFSGDFFVGMWEQILRDAKGAMWVSIQGDAVVGGIGGVVTPDLFTGDVMVIEAFWFMHPMCRGTLDSVKLLTSFEEWGALIGAKRVVMVHLDTSEETAAEGIYRRRGYMPLETSHYRAL